jgi:hypothetical protein
MRRSCDVSLSLMLVWLLSCSHSQGTETTLASASDPSPPLIRGTWALPIETEASPQPGGKVERRDQEIRVSLAVENFEKPGFERFGFWDQSGNYEHAYGGDHSGSFTYRFTGSEAQPKALEIKARLSAESNTQGQKDETSEVTLLINGIRVGKQTVVPDNGVGRFYVWRVTDPAMIRNMRLMPGSSNELRFLVDQKAGKKNGLCIYGKALDASAPEPGEPITIVYRLDEQGGPR